MAGYSIEKVFQANRDNARRAKINFNAIIEKYSREFIDDDTVDVIDNVIVAEKGSIRKLSKKTFGTTRLKTTKRKEESQAAYISGSESDCSYQTTNYGIIKEEIFEETSPDILQDLVNSFVQDPGYDPSDAETISSGSSSSSGITDDEESLSEEDGASPIIIKDEPNDIHDNPLNPNRWYSLSRYNNYNPRDTITFSNGLPVLPQSRPTPTKISIVTPEVVQEDCYYQEPTIVKPAAQCHGAQHHETNVSASNPQSPSHATRRRVPFNTLQLYGPEQPNKTFTMNSPRSNFASESSANDVTIIPTTDDSGDCFVVLSDHSMCIDQQISSPSAYLNQNNNANCEFSSSALQSPYPYTNGKEKSSVTPRRKLKPKKSFKQSRFRTFSNEDLQMFFASDDPAVAEKILSPPESKNSNEPGRAMSFDLPTEQRKKEVSKSLSILAMFNQIKSKNKSPEDHSLETGSRPMEKTTLPDSPLQNLDLSPSSHLATLRLRESPSHKAVHQQPAAFANDLQATGRRQRSGRQFRSTIALSDLQKTRSLTQGTTNGANRASFNDFQRLQESHVRQSAPPLTSENLRIFNEMNSSPCDLMLSPKRGSSIRSQPSVMILSPERPQSTPPVQINLTHVTANGANHTIDLTKSPRRSSSTQPLLRRLFNTAGRPTNPREEAQTQERSPLKLQNAPTRNTFGLVTDKVGPDRVQITGLADPCRPSSESIHLGKVQQPSNLTSFENLFQNISKSQHLKATSSDLTQGTRNSSQSVMSMTSFSVIQPILHQTKTSKPVSSPSKISALQKSHEIQSTTESSQQKGHEFQYTTESLQQKGHEFQNTTESLQQKGHVFQRTTESLQQKGHEFQNTTESLQQKGHKFQCTTESLQQKGHTFQSSRESLQQKDHVFQNTTESLQQKGHEFQSTTESLQQKGHEFQSTRKSLLQKGHEFQCTTESLQPNVHEFQSTRASLGHSKSAIPITTNNWNTHPQFVNVPRSLSDFNIKMAESSEPIQTGLVTNQLNQTGSISNQLSSMKSLSSDSSTVNIHMPASNNDVFLPCSNIRPMMRAPTSVQSNPACNSSDLRISKRRQSKSLEFQESTLQNNLNTSPNKERRMNQQIQNGFVIPQAINIIKPISKVNSQCDNIIKPVPRGSQLIRVRRRAPSKAMDTTVVSQNTETVYNWESDSSENSGHFQRPIPKFFGISSANSISPQPINGVFETSTPRKTNFIQPPSNVLNDSMSTISSELPNFADFQNGC